MISAPPRTTSPSTAPGDGDAGRTVTSPADVASLADVHAALAHWNAQETALVADLTELAAEPTTTPKDYLRVNGFHLTDLVSKAAAVADQLADANDLAGALGDRLEAFDQELKHLDTAMARIDMLADIQACVSNVTSAMAARDWETAANYVHRHLVRTAASPANQVSATTDDLPDSLQFVFPHASAMEADLRRAEAILKDTRAKLKDAILGVLQDAEKLDPVERHAHLARAFQLLPLIGEKGLGLDLYGDHVAGQLAQKCAEAAKYLDQLDAAANVQLLTKLFENIAMLIDAGSTTVEEKYGPGHLLRFIQRLHQESVKQAIILLDGWTEKRRLNHMLSLANQNVDIGARELDLILSDQVLLIQRSFLYHRFVRHRARQELAAARAATDPTLAPHLAQISNPTSRLSPDDGLPLLSAFEERIKQLALAYQTLEDTFFRTNVQRAMRLDQPLGGTPLLSSCVDDVFYLLKTSVVRAVATHDVDVACAVLQAVEPVVRHEFAGTVVDLVGSRLALFMAEPKAEVRSSMMMHLNNLQQIVLYMPKFLDEVERHAARLFETVPAPTAASAPSSPTSTDAVKAVHVQLAKRREKFSFCLAPFNKLAHALSHDMQSKLETVFDAFLKSKVQALLKHLHTNYAMNEDEYTQLVAAQQFIGNQYKFTTAFASLVANTKVELLGSSFNVLLLIMAEFWIKEWGRIVLSHRFTQWGALYLERDVRSFTAFITTLAVSTSAGDRDDSDATSALATAAGAASNTLAWAHALREKMAALTQVLTLLNLTSPQEVLDYWGPNAVSNVPWKLAAHEVRAVLRQRVEFDPNEVARVPL